MLPWLFAFGGNRLLRSRVDGRNPAANPTSIPQPYNYATINN
jgi:hypothetical protein